MIDHSDYYHVVPAVGRKWAAKRRGATRASRLFPTCAVAYRWVRRRSGWVVVHYPNGRIRRITQYSKPRRRV